MRLGSFEGFPDDLTQGEIVEELRENLRDPAARFRVSRVSELSVG